MDNPLADGPVALGVTAEIGQVMTRAQAQSFETNDAIGVIPEQTAGATGAVTQYQFNYAADKFSPGDARYYFADTNEKTFHAYYPYTAAVSENASITLDTRAGNQVVDKTESNVAWRKNDYLAATATASASKPTATYTGQQAFRHVMAQVVLKFQAGGGLTDLQPLTSYTLTTKLAMDGAFSPASGAVTVDEMKTAEKLTMGGLQPGSVPTFTSTLILLPQSVADGTLGLDVTYNNQTYRAVLSLPEGNALTAGTSYAYTVTISQNGLNVGEAQIQNWTPAETGGAEALPAPFGDKPLAKADEGDYYFSDGTLADKGAELTPAQAAACIGIVCGADWQDYDGSDYSQSGIGQKKCHGYVVALTDAHLDSETLKWANGGAETEAIDGLGSILGTCSGYARTQAIREYAEAKDKENPSQYFPAAYACLQYGEPEGPAWAHRFAAPLSSSGWFLPANYQLWGLYDARASLSSSMGKLAGTLPEGVTVGWFSEELYWTSNQKNPTQALYVNMGNLDIHWKLKSNPACVRPILAF